MKKRTLSSATATNTTPSRHPQPTKRAKSTPTSTTTTTTSTPIATTTKTPLTLRPTTPKSTLTAKTTATSTTHTTKPMMTQQQTTTTTTKATTVLPTVNGYFFDRKVVDAEEEEQSTTPIQPVPSSSSSSSKSVNDGAYSPPTAYQILEDQVYDSSYAKASSFMDWLLFPTMSHSQFMKDYFEKRVLYIDRSKRFPDYYSGVFSSDKDIPQMVKSGELEYTYDVDVALYKNGVRYTLNPSFPKVVDWSMIQDFFKLQRCSIRFLRPHQHVDLLCSMLSQFEEFFEMGSGCNAYWTPSSGSQGFAPHFDDVDVFILQLEGAKQWSLYQSREPSEMLAQNSSPNFTQEQVKGCFVTTVELKPGDLLYCPRGTIHQAKTTTSDDHNASSSLSEQDESKSQKDSLHITISTAQKMSWRQYLECAIPRAIEQATESSEEAAIALNKSLPVRYGHYMGMIHEQLDETCALDSDDTEQKKQGREKREEFRAHLSQLMDIIADNIPMDDAADVMFTRFLHDRLPPMMALSQKQRDENHMNESDLQEENPITETVKASSRIRFISNSIARLVVSDEEKCTLVHSVTNTRIYHEVEQPDELEFSIEYAPAIDHLLKAYPSFTSVSDLPELEPEEQLVLAQTLVDQRLAFCVNAQQPAVTQKKNMKALAQKRLMMMNRRR